MTSTPTTGTSPASTECPHLWLDRDFPRPDNTVPQFCARCDDRRDFDRTSGAQVDAPPVTSGPSTSAHTTAPEAGSRVRLDRVDITNPPVEPGTLGTVRRVTRFALGTWEATVDWDNGARLSLQETDDWAEVPGRSEESS